VANRSRVAYVNKKMDDSTRSDLENRIFDDLLQYYEEKDG
jgi:hypothetical protein